MTDQPQNPPFDPSQLSEEELRAAYAAQLEEQMRQLHVEDVVVQTIVTLINLAGRKAGMAPGTEGERDLGQLRMAIDASRALLPLIEAELGPDAGQIRNALSQLQMAYAQLAQEGGGEGGGGGPEGGPSDEPPQGPGPAQSSGRLWVPGQ